MLSRHDRRVLAEIEEHLQEDPALRRPLGSSGAGQTRWVRRTWFAVLLASSVLTLGMIALGSRSSAIESACLVAVAVLVLRFTSSRTGHPGRGGRESSGRL